MEVLATSLCFRTLASRWAVSCGAKCVALVHTTKQYWLHIKAPIRRSYNRSVMPPDALGRTRATMVQTVSI